MTQSNTSTMDLFAEALNPDEKILWSFAPARFQWRNLWQGLSIRRFYVVAIGLAALAIVLACLAAGRADLIPMLGFGTLFALGLGLGPGLIEIGLLRAFNTIRHPPQQEAFAVTTRQILLRRGNQLHVLDLERVPLITVFGSTLSFGAMFPMWNNVENAEQVKVIIEKAQKERLKAIQA